MLKIEINEGEKIEKAIKRYRRNVSDTKLKQEIRERKHYKKPLKKNAENKFKKQGTKSNIF